jgi:polysaccharide pyruvyl transferase WcaK-like protein
MNYMIINQNAPNNGDRAVFYFMLRGIAKTGVQSLTVSTSNPGLWKNLREFNGMQIEYVHWSGSAMVRPGRSITARIWRRVYTRYLLPLIHRMTQTAYLNGWSIRRAAWLTALCCSEMATAVRKTDAVLTTGGHRLTTILDKDMICRQRLDMTLACLFKKPVVLWSQSIGPFVFSNERDREHAKKLLQDSVRIYVRDHT